MSETGWSRDPRGDETTAYCAECLHWTTHKPADEPAEYACVHCGTQREV